jgi:DNA-binding IscR family transcriptional regulator
VCPTKLLWTRVHLSIVGTLKQTTLADLAGGAGAAGGAALAAMAPAVLDAPRTASSTTSLNT